MKKSEFITPPFAFKGFRTFDILSSDHAPFNFKGDKGKMIKGNKTPFKHIPNGVPGLETRLPLLFSNGVLVKKISITGSTRVGKLILKQAADKVQRVTMELSGHSPFIVFDDVDLNKVTDMALTAKFRNNGQVCISPNRFYIHESKKDTFAKLMVDKTKK